ncbi:MAG: GNAT family N-acetyltransferase [Planctomycetes bacterium]|nr:GNAT family N-acetyltransferase [Planctomycetota bacterium]
MEPFRTSRLVLRDATLDDVDALHAILSNAEAMRYWSTAPHTELAQTRAWTESMIAAARDGLSRDDCIVEHEGRVIGKFGFWREPELGFILHPDAQGRGFAREVLEALLERAFERRRLSHATADVDPRNERCLRLLSKLGFRGVGRAERTFLVGGVWSDSVYLQLAAATWRAARAP